MMKFLGKHGGLVATKIVIEKDPIAQMLDGDTLACRAGTGFSRDVIEIAEHGAPYHIACFYRNVAGLPWVVEMFEGVGGRRMPFDAWILQRANYSGSASEIIDVYRPDTFCDRHYDRQGAVGWMLQNIVGQPYGKATIRRFAAQASWITCWWNRACTDEDAPRPTDWVCSTAKAGADKYGGGVQPVEGLWVGDTKPGPLVQGHLYDYRLSISLASYAIEKRLIPRLSPLGRVAFGH